MNTTGLTKAADRLRKMDLAVKRLEASKSSGAAAEAWEDFVLAAGSFYSILQQATKASSKEKAWFGSLKHIRKTDPLLQYIHQARNAEEHGCERIVRAASRQVTMRNKGDTAWFRVENGTWVVEDIQGTVAFSNDTIALIPIRDDRFGDVFEPPTSHLGKTLEDRSALNVARLAHAYLEVVLTEARAMAT
jgi:hypothetical protein